MICYLLLMGAVFAEPAEPGLYAEFNTSMGSFTALLEYEKAPRTVANFVTLAEGTRPWLDFQQGRVRTDPFYEGITFHRVITNFMNQAGSPNGLGNDGPGYRFNDEFHPNLRHDEPGILSMANSGPNSNGSQFFVTVEPTSWLDDGHSVFGRVVDGMNVVSNINLVDTDVNNRPLTPVVIASVVIHRVGEDAQAFDPSAVTPPLPDIRETRSSIARNGAGNTLVAWTEEPDRHYWIWGSLNLTHPGGWQLLTQGTGDSIIIDSLFEDYDALFFSVKERHSQE